MLSDGWTTAGSIIGTVGGGAGLLALARQERDRLRRRVLPDEVRGVFLDVLSVASVVAREPQEDAWVIANVDPLTERVKQLGEAAAARASGPWSRLQASRIGLLHTYMTGIRTYANASGIPYPAAKQIAWAQNQRQAAHDVLKLCRQLLKRMP